MVRNTRQILGDEEYQFPSEEYVAVDQGPALSESTIESQTDATQVNGQSTIITRGLEILKKIQWGQHKRAIIIGSVLLVVLVVFQIMRHSDQPVKPQTTPVPAVQPYNPPVVVQPSMDTHVSDQLDNLNKDQESSHQAIQQLQGQVNDLHSALNQTSATNAQLMQAVTALMNQMKTLSTQVQTLQEKSSHKGPVYVPVVYHLQGLILGRAWIIGSNGESTTVSVGDKVKDYGTILALDDKLGVVTTSSGKTIAYGPNDQ